MLMPVISPCPPRQKISPPRKMWWKTSKKKRNFLLWNFLGSRRPLPSPPPRLIKPAGMMDQSEGWQLWPCKVAAAFRPSLPSAWTQEWTHNYHDSFCLFLFPIKEPNYTHTHIQTHYYYYWFNFNCSMIERMIYYYCAWAKRFCYDEKAQSLISFLQTRKLMIITTWRNLL